MLASGRVDLHLCSTFQLPKKGWWFFWAPQTDRFQDQSQPLRQKPHHKFWRAVCTKLDPPERREYSIYSVSNCFLHIPPIIMYQLNFGSLEDSIANPLSHLTNLWVNSYSLPFQRLYLISSSLQKLWRSLSLSLSGNIFIPTWFCKSIPSTTTGVYYHVPLAHHWKLTFVSESSRTKELCTSF